jgi:hypothetical protein
MQAASLSRPEEVNMFTRRIMACACALALAVPAAAVARPGFDPPIKTQHVVVYGDTKYDLQNEQDLGSPAVKGDTKNDVALKGDAKNDVALKGDTKNDIVVPAGKSAGAIASLTDKQLPAAYGGRLHAAHVTAAGATDDGPDGWQIAAVAEAGLLAAFALGAATFVGRMRPRRGATA